MLKDEAALKFVFFLPSPALIIHSPALTVPFPVNKFPNKDAPKMPNNILRKPLLCSFVSFLIVSVTPFNKIPECSKAWTIFIMPFISSFEIIRVVVPEPSIFCIPASAADAAAVNPNGISTLFGNGLIAFFINGNPVFNNGPRSLPRNHPD